MTTNEGRCEPPPEWRDRDGWHWVQAPVGEPHLARWHAAERDDVEPLWTSTHHVYSGTPRYAVREWGWRYIAPVTPPATVAALVEALEAAARQKTTDEMDADQRHDADFEYAYDTLIEAARAALALYHGEAGR